VRDHQTTKTDIRLIRPRTGSQGMVSARSFREDLYYRINIFPIRVRLEGGRQDIPTCFPFLASSARNWEKK